MSPWGAVGVHRRRAPTVAATTGLVLDADADGDIGFTTTTGDQDHTFVTSASEEDISIEPGVISGGTIIEDSDGDVYAEDTPIIP